MPNSPTAPVCLGGIVLSNSAPRPEASRLLEEILVGQKTIDILETDPRFAALAPLDRGLCHELVLGTLRQLRLLDEIINRFCRRPLHHLENRLQMILRIGAYQMLFLEKIPVYAAVSEAVREARQAGFRRQAGFVNAVLRNISRCDRRTLVAEPSPRSSAEDLSIHYSHPSFLVQKWLANASPEAVQGWLKRSNTPPDHFFTVIPQRISTESFIDRCREAGVDASPACPGTSSVRVSGSATALGEWVETGLCFPQDVWSHVVTHLIPERPFGDILDLCAAPGGKTFSLRMRFPAARIIAMDSSPGRLEILRHRARQLNIHLEGILSGDALAPPFPADSFDLILVDAPCSGTGTLRKNPDIRWRISQQQILRLARLQRRILATATRLLRPGGMLVYVTCSAEREENQMVVGDFLERHQERYRLYPPVAVDKRFITPEGMFQTFPQAEWGEGFFCTLFEKGNEAGRRG